MGAVPVDKAGVGSGVLNSFRQVGGSLGIAVMGAILASYLHHPPSSPLAAQDYVNGLHAALRRERGDHASPARSSPSSPCGRGPRSCASTSRRWRRERRRRRAWRPPTAAQHLIETAIRLFTEGSYHGTTTAEIARAAGISEPILYRHFASKRDLYLAALEHVWAKTREGWEQAARRGPDACAAVEAIGKGHVSVRSAKLQLAELWVQALGEASEDPELRRRCASTCARCTTSSRT